MINQVNPVILLIMVPDNVHLRFKLFYVKNFFHCLNHGLRGLS